jgi:hypothetical protein
MINNAALDVAIGLILMYLMLSLLCTVINELIATIFDLRAKSLTAALTQLLDEPGLRSAFYTQGAIAGTRKILTSGIRFFRPAEPAPQQQPAAVQPAAAQDAAAQAAPADPAAVPATSHPSYLSADTFTQALIGAVTRGLPQGQQITFGDIQTAIANLPNSEIKRALQSSIAVANNNVEVFRQRVATFFDDAMERLSGAYKRNLKVISLLVGFVVTIAFSADTFRVASTLWNDPDLRARVVDEAKSVSKKDDTDACTVTTSGNQTTTQTGTPTGTSSGTRTQLNLDELKKAIANTEDCLRPFPIGWTSERSKSYWRSKNIPTREWWLTTFGFIVTGLALSLGAPFWFDLLGKFINIRGAGPKPQRADGK